MFSLHAFPNEYGTPRLGLSVSRRVGNAVTRNTVRRRLREIFHTVLPEIPSDLDLVISARPAVAEATYGELNEEFVRSLRKLGESRKHQKGGPR
jgi:ribonuclease P protein component